MSVVIGPEAAAAAAPQPAGQRRERRAPRVLVTVGTDHHPFDRLMTWLNDWLRQHQEQAGSFFVQWGTASVTLGCPGQPFLTTQQLAALLDEAAVVICHGGPGSIAEALARGHVPIVVPRLHRFGEVVDDHQVDFCARLAELGRVRLAHTPADLARFLGAAAHDRASLPAGGLDGDAGAAVARFAALVDELAGMPRRLPLLPYLRAGRRRGPAAGARAHPAASHALRVAREEPTSGRARRSRAHFGVTMRPEEEQE